MVLPHSRRELWPILIKTDWINRAIGLPPVDYDIQPLPEGGTRVTARAKMFGLQLSWQELPFEWAEPKFYRVRRVFESGPFSEAVVGLRLRDAANGCTIDILGDFQPKNAFGEFLARHVLGPKSLRDMRNLIQHVGKHLAGQQQIVMPKLPAAAPNASALAAGLEKLRASKQPARAIERLAKLLTESADVELTHIRPLAVARLWHEDGWQVLRLFLHATRAGLVNMRWEVLCPNCRSSRVPPTTSLAELAHTAHCDVCNIKFDAEFDKSVELKFSVHPSVRPCDDQTFCLAGPGGKPHIVSQIVVAPNSEREWEIPDLTRHYRLRSLQVKRTALFPPHASLAQAVDVQIVCGPELFDLRAAPAKGDATAVRVKNPNAYPVTLVLEGSEWDDDILTAARATNWQEFRDLFAREIISPSEQVTVGSQVVLFTDLRGSTAMYSRIGDAPAYVLVRDHFKILQDAVSAHHGAIVKTIGDAIMAVFSNLAEALAAVKQMHEQLPQVQSADGSRLQLKSGLHSGPCLAVNANDKLDFFGTTVNLAARLVENCQGDDLTITEELYQNPATQSFLKEMQNSGVSGEKQFTGFASPVKVWRIAMRA